jgi:DNA-binding CsgD family transcriptional regulator
MPPRCSSDFVLRKCSAKPCSSVVKGTGVFGTEFCHENCTPLQCAREGIRIPNFDLNVTTQSEERIWINVSSIVFSNHRTGETLLVHLARDITRQKQREELFGRMVAISKQVETLGEETTGAVPVSPLSAQEIEVIRMFAAGRTAPQVAKNLGISPQTLRNHLHHINQKLRTHNRLEAVMQAMQRGLI